MSDKRWLYDEGCDRTLTSTIVIKRKRSPPSQTSTVETQTSASETGFTSIDGTPFAARTWDHPQRLREHQTHWIAFDPKASLLDCIEPPERLIEDRSRTQTVSHIPALSSTAFFVLDSLAPDNTDITTRILRDEVAKT